MTTFLAASGYGRQKTKEKHLYRWMTFEEAKSLRPGSYVMWLDRNNEIRDAKVNGQPKTWKTRPGDLSVPLKYGMYEFFNSVWQDGKPLDDMLVVRVEKNPKRRSTFKSPFTVDVWLERGEGKISVDDARGHEIAFWDTEGIEGMIQDGYFDASGFIMGREVRPGRLEQSVLNYLKNMGVITKAELA